MVKYNRKQQLVWDGLQQYRFAGGMVYARSQEEALQKLKRSLRRNP